MNSVKTSLYNLNNEIVIPYILSIKKDYVLK